MHWTQYIIIKVIYQDRLVNLNYKDFPCHGAVICNYCWNCLTVMSHDPFQEIIPNNIQWNIEIVHNQCMLNNDAHVRVTFKVCLLLYFICQDLINSHGSDNRGNRSFTNNSMPCQCKVFIIGWGGSCSWCLWCWFNDSHKCGYMIHKIVCCTTPFGPNLLLCRIVSRGLSLLVECSSLVRRKCLLLLLGIVHIFNSYSNAALAFLLSSSFVVRWLYPLNIQLRSRDLLALIDECIVQRDTSILISSEGISSHDLSLECVKLIYLDNLNQMSDLEPRINPHMPMFLETFKDMVLILLNFHVAFKVEPLTFNRVMCDYEDPFFITCHVIQIIWSQ